MRSAGLTTNTVALKTGLSSNTLYNYTKENPNGGSFETVRLIYNYATSRLSDDELASCIEETNDQAKAR